MNAVYDKPALNLTCPKCGCKIATTKWEDIDLDDTKYKTFLDVIGDPNIEQIRFIFKLTGFNFIASKDFLQKGGLVFEGFAIDVLEKKKELNKEKISYSIEPLY